jgi:hypothetical protein
MARRGTLRASDSDREQVAERLRQAAAEGRLLAEELEHRLARALRARTYGELDPLVADLPRSGAGIVRHRRHLPLPVMAVATVLAVVVVAAVVAAAVLLVTGLLVAWGVWLLVISLVFGRSRRAWFPMQCARRRVYYAHRRSLL